jgi:uncharacterized protein YggE
MFKKIILLLAMSLLLAVPAWANAAPNTVVQVTGNSQKEIAPDIARIHVAIQSTQANLDKAKAENSKNVNQVLAKLQQLGVTDEQITTDTYQISPLYNYEKDRLPVLTGYRVSQGLEIRTSLEQVGILVDEMTKAGANEISSIRFEAADETSSKNEALKEAVADALKKADVIAASLGKKVARITLVNESGVFYRPVMMEARMLKAAAMDSSVPNIPAGKVTVGATVQVSVELE